MLIVNYHLRLGVKHTHSTQETKVSGSGGSFSRRRAAAAEAFVMLVTDRREISSAGPGEHPPHRQDVTNLMFQQSQTVTNDPDPVLPPGGQFYISYRFLCN